MRRSFTLAKGKLVEPHRRRSAYFMVAFGVVALLSMVLTIDGQTPHPSAPLTAPNLTSDQIVKRMVERNLKRSEALRGYSDERHYTITYDGIPKKVTAAMVVEATY